MDGKSRRSSFFLGSRLVLIFFGSSLFFWTSWRRSTPLVNFFEEPQEEALKEPYKEALRTLI
jgi:hypothetical protein